MVRAKLKTLKKKKTSQWWVYMVETEKGKLYTGITTDLARRLRQHKGELKGGAKFFSSDKALGFRFQKKCKDRSSASKLEARIKGLKREEKLKLLK
jgi:putative endonuclease